MRTSQVSLQLLTAIACMCIFIQASAGQVYDTALTQESLNAESELLQLLQMTMSKLRPNEDLISRRPTRQFGSMDPYRRIGDKRQQIRVRPRGIDFGDIDFDGGIFGK